MTAVTATNRYGASFTHEFSTVTGPSGHSWPQCSCTYQATSDEDAEAHLDAVRSWQAHEDTL